MNKKKYIAAGVILVIAISLILIKSENNQNDSSGIPYAGPNGNLSEVKVATVYEKVVDRESVGGRSLAGTVKVLKEVQTDFIFLGFWTWTIPAPDSPDNMPPELLNHIADSANTSAKNVPEFIRRIGYSYEELRKSIPAIKKEMPGVIFAGGIPAEALGRIETDPMTNEMIGADDTWAMAFDPQKWNINYTCPEDICKDFPSLKGNLMDKEGFQEYFALSNHLLNPGEMYDRQKVKGYYPDLTNLAFQELLVNRAKKLIDSGADAVWVDLLYTQAQSLRTMLNSANHPAVKDSYDAASKVVDAIHKYGESKGKQIYVGTWAEPVINYEWQAPKLDFVTVTPEPEEIYYGKFNEEKWDKINSKVDEKLGKIPRFVFVDFGWAKNSPMDVFSQMLSKKQQREWLGKADVFFQDKGMIFMYPVHGGDFTPGAKRLSFGKNAKYDSLAPEFDTFNTIKDLAKSKKRE